MMLFRMAVFYTLFSSIFANGTKMIFFEDEKMEVVFSLKFGCHEKSRKM
jgi:hypothetical protein